LPTSWAATETTIFLSTHPGDTPASTAIGGILPASWAATRAAILSTGCYSFHYRWGHLACLLGSHEGRHLV
jgi:hypothetical protein